MLCLAALRERGVVIKDTVVEPDGNHCVILALHNYNFHTVRLEKGHTLGRLQEVTRLSSPINPEKQPAELESTVKVV